MKKYDLFITERQYDEDGSLCKLDKKLSKTVDSLAEARRFVKDYNNSIKISNQNFRVKEGIKRKKVNQYGWYNYTTLVASYKKRKSK